MPDFFSLYQEEEVAMLMELSHLQEVMDKLEAHTTEPYSLPPASEQVKLITFILFLIS